MARSEETRLIARARRGNAEAFRALVETYKERLFAFVYRTVRNHHEAEDLTQQAFVKAYESLASYSDAYAFSTWLYTIAYRMCLNQQRRRRPLSGDFDFSRIGAAQAEHPEVLANTEESRRLQERIWHAVDGLTTAQRSAVLLFYREGKSCQEIGEVLGMPAVTVKSHLHRAREKLRLALQGELVEDWSALRFSSESA
jgi:RNA polymerase sigma-70 factor (ECF subfamily)